jgi:hypothetical protein
MADPIKELKEALVEGVQRLIEVDQAQKHFQLQPPGREFFSGIAFGGGNGIRELTMTTTGFDPVTGLTTVAFVLGASAIDGDDVLAM